VIRSDLKRIHLVPHGVGTSRGVRGGDSRKVMRARPLGSRHSLEEGQEISREAGDPGPRGLEEGWSGHDSGQRIGVRSSPDLCESASTARGQAQGGSEGFRPCGTPLACPIELPMPLLHGERGPISSAFTKGLALRLPTGGSASGHITVKRFWNQSSRSAGRVCDRSRMFRGGARTGPGNGRS
jgi:hypothetical protein